MPAFKDADRRLLAWYERQLKNLGVECRCNTELSAQDVLQLHADEIVVATGSRPRKLPVPGGELGHVMAAEDVLLGKKQPGKRVVLVGGGQVGCETALWLEEQGCDVTVVESLDTLISGKAEPIPQPNRDMLIELLQYHRIPAYTGTTVKEITADYVLVSGKNGDVKLPADTVVVSIGYIANNDLYRTVYGASDKPVWLLGDAKAPGNIMTAVRDGSAIGAIL